MDYILHNHTNLLRFGVFLTCLLTLILWETRHPRRANIIGWGRKLNNLALIIIDTFLVRLLLPITAISMAETAGAWNWGLFNTINTGFWPALCLSILLLDLIIYGQHRMMHKLPLLWRLHRVHHTDPELDVTTALRFHPLEIILSMAIKLCAISLLGPPVIAVISFEIMLNISSMFNHSNIFIPAYIERRLRYFIVTPDMHRVHHSVKRAEIDSNYGFNLPWWDHIFDSYKAQPTAGHVGMDIGLQGYHGNKAILLNYLLIQPFTSKYK